MKKLLLDQHKFSGLRNANHFRNVFFSLLFFACAYAFGQNNIAINRPATASSQSSTARTPSMAVDANAATEWRSVSQTNPWIYVDLGTAHNIARVSLNWSTYYGRAYRIQTSANAITWTTIATISGQNGGMDNHVSLTGVGRYVRIYVTSRSNSSRGVYLREFEIYGNVVSLPTACGSISNNGFESGLTGWVSDGNVSLSTDAHSGTNAAMSGPAEGGVNYQSLIGAVGGQSVSFKVWAKISAATTFAGIGIDYLDGSGTEITEAMIQVTSSTYLEHTIEAIAPPGTANIRIWTWKAGTTGNLFMDDFCLTVSGSSSDTEAPSVPAGLSSSNVTSNSFLLAWTPSNDNTAVTGYEIFRNGVSIGTSTAPTFSVTGLASGTTYAMTVRARDAVPNWSAQSVTLNITTLTISDNIPPSVPTGLIASAISQTSFNLSWTASTDNNSVSGYEVFRNGSSLGTTASTSMTVSGLTCNTSYTLSVRARDAVPNWSSQSSVLNVTTSECSSFPNENSSLGTNLSEPSALTLQDAFINIAKRAMVWTTDGAWPQASNTIPNSSISHDGYLKGGVNGRSAVIWDVVTGYTGSYVMRYEGTGTVTLTDAGWGGFSQTSNTLGRIAFTLNNCRMLQVQIQNNSTTDPIKNIRITKAIYENSSEIFDPEFVANWERFSTFRFMNWMLEAGKFVRNWQSSTGDYSNATAPKVNDFSYALKGVPVDIMVALCNRMHVNPWFTVQHAGTNDYFTQFATYVRNNLSPDLITYIEYSNETWNSAPAFLEVNTYVNNQGLSMWPTLPAWEAGQKYHARRSGELWTLWEQVFGGTSRFIRVMGGFTGHANEYWNDLKLLTDNVYLKTDAININFYFGHEIGSSVNPVTSVNDVFAKIPAAKASLYSDMDNLRNILANDSRYAHIKIVAYEGGQHLDQRNEAVFPTLVEANRDIRMASEYIDMLNNWKQRGGTLFCHYSSVYTPSIYGSWGALERQTGNAPNQRIKYDALLTWMSNNPKWWSTAGSSSSLMINNNAEQSLGIYPNPADSEISLRIKSDTDRPVKVELFNMMNKLEHSIENPASDEDGNITLKTTELPAGIYILRVTDKQKTSTQTVFIKR